jgi:hypothetical protein
MIVGILVGLFLFGWWLSICTVRYKGVVRDDYTRLAKLTGFIMILLSTSALIERYISG